MSQQFGNRRDFLKFTSIAFAFPIFTGCRGSTLAHKADNDILSEIKKNAITSGDQSWSGAKDAPAGVTWNATLARPNEEGELILISGTVFLADGKTPAPDTLIYLYHTDIYGHYGRGGEHRHGRYRGWMLTDSRGRYEFRTVKPASYPNSTIASHIHMTVTRRDLREDWVDSILFEGDRFITAQERIPRKGGIRAILSMDKGTDGISRGRRDIVLWT